MSQTRRAPRTTTARTTPVRTAQPRAVAPTRGGIEHAAWLSERLLVVVAWAQLPRSGRGAWAIELTDGAAAGAAPVIVVPPGERAEAGTPFRLLGMVLLGEADAASGRAPGLRFARGATRVAASGEQVASALVDVRTLVRESLAGLPAPARERIVPWLAHAAELHGDDPGAWSLARRLHAARESLREQRPACEIAAEEPRGLQIETLLAIDERTYWIKGWARDADARITGLTAIAPEGCAGEFLERTLALARPDVEEFYATGAAGRGEQRSGFVGLVRLGAPSRLSSGWIVHCSDAIGETIEAEAPAVVRDPLAVRAALLTDFALARRAEEAARAELFAPALARLQERLAAAVEVEDVRAHGRAPRDPEVSIVVPLYRRIDFLTHQLTQFARDPALARADLVYVLDSPEQREELERLAPELHALTGVPFRVVTLSRNAGFAGANNAGAALARADKLLLLNSDVLPSAPGWLGAMSAFFDATPGIGALAPKLLYEDDSLQHAGMYFLRAPGASTWENMHYFKGLARTTPAANVARRVPAVTGACLMLARERWEALGGLHGQYVQGDYEDSDLCLRLHEQGLGCWYLPDAELHHLEAQSYPNELRRATSAYNAWLHSHLWDERIAELMACTKEVAA
jgi:GT2 family glycosyltransferase